MQTIREQIGEESYIILEKEAEIEVDLAIHFLLTNQYKQELYYHRRSLLTILLNEFEKFESRKFKFTPIDIVNILFDAKLQRACKTEQEYFQRRGGRSLFVELPFRFQWDERSKPIEEVITTHLEGLAATIFERTLASGITNFQTDSQMGSATKFFEDLFEKLQLPFSILIDDDTRIIGNQEIQKENSGVAFSAVGSYSYVYYYAQAYLRTFLNMLRISNFLNPGQISFGSWDIIIMAPTGPWFLSTNEISGAYSWNEDEKRPWEKIPDGCLFLSFGYRGISPMWLDSRTFSGMEKIFIENKVILDELSNPWSNKSINDIATSLDILSAATQLPDLGAKILQIYCCLEHLFVPKGIQKDNIKYIVGAINVLNPKLLPWFDKIYQLRCNYAHKGYVKKDSKTRSLISESIHNVIMLLTAKLKQS